MRANVGKHFLSTLCLWFFGFLCNGQGTFVYDQQSGDESTLIGAVTTIQSHQPIGQSFTPSTTAVGFIRLSLNDATPGNSAGATVFVNLRANSITGTVLGSSDAVSMPDNFGRGTNGYVNFFFPSPVTLIPGTTYYFQPVVQSGDTWQVGAYNFPVNYAGGTAYYDGVASGSDDLWFREGIVVPEPSTICLGIFGAATIILFGRHKLKK